MPSTIPPLLLVDRSAPVMQFIEEDYDYEPEPEPEPALDFAERMRIMLTAFRRAPTIRARELEERRRRYREWREERLTPFVSVLADIVLRSIGVET